MLVMPLFSLSGRALPAPETARPAGRGHPGRPITDAAYPKRHAVFSHPNISPRRERGAVAGTQVGGAGGWAVPVGLSIGIVAVMGAVMLGMAVAEFQRTV